MASGRAEYITNKNLFLLFNNRSKKETKWKAKNAELLLWVCITGEGGKKSVGYGTLSLLLLGLKNKRNAYTWYECMKQCAAVRTVSQPIRVPPQKACTNIAGVSTKNSCVLNGVNIAEIQ